MSGLVQNRTRSPPATLSLNVAQTFFCDEDTLPAYIDLVIEELLEMALGRDAKM